ncbi:MAG: hypothetical protein MK165_04010 [Pirellulaceae bacterium]|nr:hypothetical protein [Pirellulaceae bacterium]
MKSIGTEGSLPIHETYPHFSICDAEGWQSLATTYWASLQGQRSGARQDELSYFVECIRSESPPAVITAGDYGRGVLAAVQACLAAEESVAKDRILLMDRNVAAQSRDAKLGTGGGRSEATAAR